MSRTIVVGDVHGMLPELVRLLSEVRLTRDDTVVFVGDLLDKGPDSVGVVQYLVGLRREGFSIVLVLGNHEEKHARYRHARTKTPMPNMVGAEGMEEITNRLEPADLQFLESAVLLHRLPEHNALVVHGGIPPAMTELPTDAIVRGPSFKAWHDLLRTRHVTGVARTKLTLELEFDKVVHGRCEEGEPLPRGFMSLPPTAIDADIFVRRKTVKPAGSFIALGQETPRDPFWADVYDGRFGHVYFGHNPFLELLPKRFPHATGLDLGCVFGGYLAAAALEPGCEPRWVAVPASAKFASGFWEDGDR